jgi:hypothetical protein
MENGVIMKKLNLSFMKGLPEQILCGDNTGIMFADSSYRYFVSFEQGDRLFKESEVTNLSYSEYESDNNKRIRVEGQLGALVGFCQNFVLSKNGSWFEETIALTNLGGKTISIKDLKFGFRSELKNLDSRRLIAVPFRVQVDNKVHDYSVKDLLNGSFSNSDQKEHCWTEEGAWPDTMDKDKLRSEGWLWTDGQEGILIAKYNNDHIEMSVAEVEHDIDNKKSYLQFGGIGFCLYNEPQVATELKPGASFTFGVTRYEIYNGGISEGYNCYKQWLRSKGHGFPENYNAPLNWEVLYDLGWFLCDQEKLKKFYNLETVREEARKAKEVGAELLYLDPGWETCEGVNVWDEQRLGNPKDFINEMKNDFGLDVGFRTVGQVYRDEFPHKWYCKPSLEKDERGKPGLTTGKRVYWQTCACCEDWWKDHVQKMTDVAKNGMKFMMHDENSWFGPCFANDHGHLEPTTPESYVKALYGAIREMRKSCPEMVIECHDPVWSWFVRYLPVYFMQGFDVDAGYQENWGFEMMWNCIQDLIDGRAKVLYYYAMGTNIPIYLHTSMITDNDELLFFWWAASTVRHLAIGGKYHNFQPELREKYCPDVELRWASYKEQIKLYKSLKPYFVQGEFYGLGEEAHLHTLNDRSGAVLNLFNLSEKARQMEVSISAEKLKIEAGMPVKLYGDAGLEWSGNNLVVSTKIKALAPKVLVLGDAVGCLKNN